MIRPKEKAPSPAGIRMPKHSSSAHVPRHSGVSTSPSTAMAAPPSSTNTLEVFSANAPNTGCITPNASCAAASTKLIPA